MKYVLFVCDRNAGRSQMAEALFNNLAPDDVRAESAGSAPADAVHPVVVEAMREIGLDVSARRPRRLTVEMQLHADWAVTMGCGDACPYVPSMVEAWDIADPGELPIEQVRLVRDEIATKVRDLVEIRLDEIRSDRTAHQMRLGQMLPTLIREFETLRRPEEIRDCADAILDQYGEATVRSHVQAIALRQTRECLRAERCTALDPVA